MSESFLFSMQELSSLQIVPLHKPQDGQRADCFALLVERLSSTTRDGKPYYRATFRNRSRAISQPIWSDSPWFDECRQHWKSGDFFKIRAVYREDERYGGQLDIEKIRLIVPEDQADGFNPADFSACSRFAVDEMFPELCQLAEEHIAEPALRQLVLQLLRAHEATIKIIPAATHHHHAFTGGFLEHTLSVARSCVYLAEKYREYYRDAQPPLDESLIVAGGILHDIGKVRELEYHVEGADYTVEGRLIGHILIGRDLVREAAAQIADLDAELLLRLEHIIVAHQNLPEWGSPKLPHTPESLLVHYADDLDAKLQMFMHALQTDTNQGPFTSRNNPLKRHFYRGRGE